METTSQTTPETVFHRRYVLQEIVGQGGGGTVYRAMDRLTGQTVALKRPQHWDKPAEEFATISRLEHPCILKVLDFARDSQGRPFFTMELLPGAGDPKALHGLPMTRFYQVARDLLRTLHYLHAQGVVHADLKPANIYLPQEGGALKLLDFGLALAHTAKEGMAPRGTLAYMAPEVLHGQAPSSSCDLYGLGAVLYEALVGQAPFLGDAQQILQAKIQGKVPCILDHRPDLSEDLAEVLKTLMQPSAQLRYRSAAEVAEAMQEATAQDPSSPDDWSLNALTGRARLVERESFLHNIARLLGWEDGTAESEEVEEEFVSVLWLTGEPGAGCSRLMKEAALQARQADLQVMEVDAAETTSALDDLARFLHLQTPSKILAACKDPDKHTWRLESILDEMLRHLSLGDPLLLVLDNAEEVDPLTEQWLRLLARKPDQGHLSCLVASQPHGAPTHGVRKLAVAPLSRQGIAQLLWNHLGVVEHADELAEHLHNAAGGSPAMVEVLLQHLIAHGGLRMRSGRWFTNLEKIAPLLREQNASSLQAAKLDRLPADLQEALGCAAVLGRRADRKLLDTLCPGYESRWSDIEAQGLITLGAQELLFTRDLLRQEAYNRLDRHRQRSLHEQALTFLGRLPDQDATVMAHHALGAGKLEAHIHWARQAAEASLEVFRLQEAASWFASAVSSARASKHMDQAQQLTVAQGQAHLQNGEAAEAVECFTRVLREGPEQRSEWALTLGTARAEMGKHEAALEAFAWARRLPNADLDALLFAESRSLSMLGRYVEVRAQLGPMLREARTKGEHQRFAKAAVVLGTVACHDGHHEKGIKLLEEAAQSARRIHDLRQEADAMLNLGTALRYRGDLGKAAETYRQASKLYEDQGLLPGVAKGRNNEGVVAYLRGRWGEAQTSWESFQELVERLGLANECVHAYNNLGTLYKDRGELEKAVRTFHRGVALARDIQYSRFEAMLLGNLGEALVRLERFEEAEIMLSACMKQSTNLGAKGEVIETVRRQADLELARDELVLASVLSLQALQEYDDALPGIERGHLLRIAGAAALGQGHLDKASEHLTQARQLLEKQGARYELATTLLVEGELQMRRGAPQGAVQTFDRAIQLLEPLGARRELVQAQEALRRAQKEQRQGQHGDQNRLRLVLDVARKLGPINDLSVVLETVLDVALEITGHERGFVLLYNEDGVEMTVARHISPHADQNDLNQPSWSIADEVARTCRSVGSLNLQGDARFNEQESVLAMGLCSVRCVPIMLGLKLLGVIYIDSSRLDREEAVQEELDLLEALAGPASMAIENTRLLAQERRKVALIARTAHEINRPLAAILGFAQDLCREDSAMGPEERRSAKIIYQQGERLSRLTKHLLDLQRNGTAVKLRATRVAPELLLQEVIDALEPLWKEKGHLIDYQLETDSELLVDRDRVQQAVTKSLSNAIKFTPDSGTITLRTKIVQATEERIQGNTASWTLRREPWEQERDLTRLLQLEIEDSGPGISPRDREAIFEPFVQRSTDPTLRNKGTGLGLAITKEVVHAHSGRIWVENVPDSGARFCLTLPVALEGTTDGSTSTPSA